MRKIAFSLIVASAFALSSCSSLPFRHKAPPTSAPDEESLPVPSTQPSDGTERIDRGQLPIPKKKGFFSKLSRGLGGDAGTANVGPCPAVRVLYDASRFVELDGAERFENVGWTGEIQNVNAECRYVGDDPIDLRLVIDMAIGKGPKATGEYKDVKYWIAVTRKDIAPIEKRNFTGRVFFHEGQDRYRLSAPQVNIMIPRANGEISGANFEILVGFDLTPEQLQFNRDGKRFRIDAGVRH